MARFSLRMGTAHRSFVREILNTEDPIISFAGGPPNPRFFPVTELARATEKTLAEGGAAALQYATTEGYAPLREYIAARYAQRGLTVSAEEILITNCARSADRGRHPVPGQHLQWPLPEGGRAFASWGTERWGCRSSDRHSRECSQVKKSAPSPAVQSRTSGVTATFLSTASV